MPSRVTPFQKLWVKIFRFEFWPFSVFYFPVYFYYAFLSIKSRSLFFFTASNPSIDFGGMLGEKKSEIFDIIPKKFIPVTKVFDHQSSFSALVAFLNEAGLDYPIIAKPDIGERGWMVEKIHSETQLKDYLQKIQVDFLIQEFIDLPVELGVFYVRVPGKEKGEVTSIVRKGFLTVEGDGKTNVKDLLLANVRATIQLDFEEEGVKKWLPLIPKKGEVVEIESIGNHCRGTVFLNDNDQIDDRLSAFFDLLSGQIEGFYFGRFDIRCQSIDQLKEGSNFKILELNGAGSEPGHIYHPGFSIIQAYKDVFRHFNLLQKVSQTNHKKGTDYWSFSEGWRKMQEIRRYNRMKAQE